MTWTSTDDVYEELGVRPIINCQGNRTALGGSSPSPEVLEAMEEANGSYVVMSELMVKSGEYVADLLDVEAAYITAGCAAALALSAAACIAGRDPENRGRLPHSAGMKNEIVIQKRQRYSYDRAYTVAGGVLVEAGDEAGCSQEQLESAIGPNTAAVAYLLGTRDGAVVSREDAVELAHAHGVPAIVDAAAHIYPLDYFQANASSADLVCFGAKYFGAPQSTGFVCGRKDLVEAAAEHGYIAFQSQPDGQRAFGRPMKVDRQSIVGMTAALRIWITIDHEDRLARIEGMLSTVQRRLDGLANVRTQTVHSDKYWGNSLHVTLDTQVLGLTPEQVARELDAGDPRIWVGLGAGDYYGNAYQHDPMLPADTLVINAHAWNEGEAQIVAERLGSVLQR